MGLSQNNKSRIYNSILHNRFDKQNEINHLINEGFTRESAIVAISNEIDSIKQQLYEEKLKRDEDEEREKGAIGFGIMISCLISVFNLTDFIWVLCSSIVLAGLGYWGFRRAPFAGALGGIILGIVSPFIYSWYIQGRTTMLKIEFLIPSAISLGVAFLVGFLVVKIAYQNDKASKFF